MLSESSLSSSSSSSSFLDTVSDHTEPEQQAAGAAATTTAAGRGHSRAQSGSRRAAAPNMTGGASGVVTGVKGTKKTAEEQSVAYFPVAIADGTANHRTFSFPTNKTRTTKSTPVTFIFRLLIEQYKKATNVCCIFSAPPQHQTPPNHHSLCCSLSHRSSSLC